MPGRMDFPAVCKDEILDPRGELIGHLCSLVLEEVQEFDQAAIHQHCGLNDDTQHLRVAHGPNGHGTCVLWWYQPLPTE